MLTTLFSLTCIIPAVWLGYTLRAFLIARRDWGQFSADTKAFFLLVAPPMSLATDLFLLTDRLFYSPAKRLEGSQ